jgi:hypothetical protein
LIYSKISIVINMLVINNYDEIKSNMDKGRFLNINSRLLGFFYILLGLTSSDVRKIPKIKGQQMIVNTVIPMETILDQTKWYTRTEMIPLLLAIQRYVDGSTFIVKESRLSLPYNRNTFDKAILEEKDKNASDPAKYYNSMQSYIKKLYRIDYTPLSVPDADLLNKIFRKWGITHDVVNNEEVDLSPRDYYKILYTGIMTSPRSKKPFTVYRYSYDYNGLMGVGFKPVSDHKVGDKVVTTSILSTSYTPSPYILSFADSSAVGAPCSNSCCIYTIEVPANFPALFVNQGEEEVLLPPKCIFEVLRFRVVDVMSNEQPTIVVKDKPTKEELSAICKSSYMLIIDFKIVGMKKE